MDLELALIRLDIHFKLLIGVIGLGIGQLAPSDIDLDLDRYRSDAQKIVVNHCQSAPFILFN